MYTALTIAGSDCSGGAGIQADIKTMTMNGVYAMSAITALTAQNTTGVRAIQETTPAFLKHQIDAIFEDIFPDAVKIGMVANSELIRVIAERLRFYNAKNIVVDPVMVATSGSALMKNDAVQTLIDELLPLSTLVTPNIPEAEVLCGFEIKNQDARFNKDNAYSIKIYITNKVPYVYLNDSKHISQKLYGVGFGTGAGIPQLKKDCIEFLNLIADDPEVIVKCVKCNNYNYDLVAKNYKAHYMTFKEIINKF